MTGSNRIIRRGEEKKSQGGHMLPLRTQPRPAPGGSCDKERQCQQVSAWWLRRAHLWGLLRASNGWQVMTSASKEANLPSGKVLFYQVKKEAELLVSGLLGNFFNLDIFSFSAELFAPPKSVKIPSFIICEYLSVLLFGYSQLFSLSV